MKKRTSPFVIFVMLGVILALALIIPGVYYLPIHWGIAYLCGVNFAVFCLYGYDKWVAGRDILRVPEKVLHLFTLLGGTPLAFISQRLFRHKTVKGSFQLVFWGIFVVQIVAVWKLFS